MFHNELSIQLKTGKESLIEFCSNPRKVGFIIYTSIKEVKVVRSSPWTDKKIKLGTKYTFPFKILIIGI